ARYRPVARRRTCVRSDGTGGDGGRGARTTRERTGQDAGPIEGRGRGAAAIPRLRDPSPESATKRPLTMVPIGAGHPGRCDGEDHRMSMSLSAELWPDVQPETA